MPLNSSPVASREAALEQSLREADLDQLGLLDSGFEAAYDELASLAAELCTAPIALITLLDRKRQWFKARFGLDVPETPREFAFCQFAVREPGVMEVVDARTDPRFKDNPLVTGSPYIGFYAGAPLRGPSGVALGTLCVIDHQPRRLSEAQRRWLETLARQATQLLILRATARALRVSRDVLRDSLNDQQHMLAVVAHDLRGPLSAAYGMAELLQCDLREHRHAEASRRAGLLRDACARTIDLSDGLLSWAASEAGSLRPQRDLVHLAEMVSEAAAACSMSIEEKRIELLLRAPQRPALLQTDLDMLRSVLMNVLGNAVKFSPVGGRIEVSWEQNGSQCELHVCDRGQGFDSSVLVALRSGAQRLASRPGTGGEQGSGLGLALSLRLVHALGGSLAFRNRHDGGTRAVLTIPLANPDDAHAAAPETDAPR